MTTAEKKLAHAAKQKRWRKRHPETWLAIKKRYWARVKADPVRRARIRAYNSAYMRCWRAAREKQWVWNGHCLVLRWLLRLDQPLPRHEEVTLPVAHRGE